MSGASGFVLHDLGAAEAGAPWRAALPAGWEAPDLPGHGTAPAPRHGAYDPMGTATLARWALGGRGTVVGVGQNAHAALLVAGGGGASALVVVDGLWGRWSTAEEAVADTYRGLRRVLDDGAATGPPPASGLDPRTAHGYGVHMSPALATGLWGAVTVPVLAVETPASPTPPAERGERLGWFGGPRTLVELDSPAPAGVVATVLEWAGALPGA